jgi:hypothetical protein
MSTKNSFIYNNFPDLKSYTAIPEKICAGDFQKTIKEELMPIIHHLFQKIAAKRTLLISFD